MADPAQKKNVEQFHTEVATEVHPYNYALEKQFMNRHRWVLGDAKRRGWEGFKRWGWIPAMMMFGSPALLIYLAVRPKQSVVLPQ